MKYEIESTDQELVVMMLSALPEADQENVSVTVNGIIWTAKAWLDDAQG